MLSAHQIIPEKLHKSGNWFSSQEDSISTLHEKLSTLSGPANTILEVIFWHMPIPFDPIAAKYDDCYFPIGCASEPSIQDTQNQAQSLRLGNLRE